MKIFKSNKKLILIYAAILMISLSFIPLVVSEFNLPSWGGAMVHSDPQMSENIRLPVPTENVSELWRRNDLGGEFFGTWGNGIAGNGKIAANTFTNYLGKDNLIIYDYYGNQLWSSEKGKSYSLNFLATSSSPMVDINNRVVACDNEKIIMINASNVNNITLQWKTDIPHEKVGPFERIFFPLPFSPTIVENKTIILPTKGGAVFVYDAENGTELINITLGENETNETYWGFSLMNHTEYYNLMINYTLHSICPFKYNITSQLVENRNHHELSQRHQTLLSISTLRLDPPCPQNHKTQK
jgi:hypothetical protein